MVWTCAAINFAEAKSAEEAEYDRLVSEMTRFSKTQSWIGVNKRFSEMEKLGLEIGVNELLIAAQASQGLGNIYEAKSRVTRALLLREKKSTRKWYTQLNNNYGQVTLIARNKSARELEQLQITMDPIQSQCILFAKESLETKGEFRGLLPLGQYNFGGQVFVVKPDMDIHLEISPRLKRKLENQKD
jgi:hypothetical protein